MVRATRLTARSIRRRDPPDSVPTRRSAISPRSRRVTRSSARTRAVEPSPERRATSSRFSRPVRNSSRPAYWPVTPIRRRTRSASAMTSTPSMSDPAGCRSDQGGEHADQRRLAGAVVAQYAEGRSGFDRHVDPGEGMHVAEANVHTLRRALWCSCLGLHHGAGAARRRCVDRLRSSSTRWRRLLHRRRCRRRAPCRTPRHRAGHRERRPTPCPAQRDNSGPTRSCGEPTQRRRTARRQQPRPSWSEPRRRGG